MVVGTKRDTRCDIMNHAQRGNKEEDRSTNPKSGGGRTLTSPTSFSSSLDPDPHRLPRRPPM